MKLQWDSDPDRGIIMHEGDEATRPEQRVNPGVVGRSERGKTWARDRVAVSRSREWEAATRVATGGWTSSMKVEKSQ